MIPCAMIGGFEFQPPGRIMPRLGIRPGVRFGKPLDFSRYYGLEQDRLVLRAVTDEIMYAIMKLSGQEYVDQYAQRAKVGVRLPLRHRGPEPAAGNAGFGDTGSDGAGPAGTDGLPGPAAADQAAGVGETVAADRTAAVNEPADD